MTSRPLNFQLSATQAKTAIRHLNLARREAWRFQRRTAMAYDDLESAAFLGLLKACHRFEPVRGHAFSSYAVPLIKGELLHHVRDTSYLLRISHRLRELWVRGRRHLERGRSDQQIAEALQIPLSEWLEARQACTTSVVPLQQCNEPAAPISELEDEDRLQALEQAVTQVLADRRQAHQAADPRDAAVMAQLLETIRTQASRSAHDDQFDSEQALIPCAIAHGRCADPPLRRDPFL